jgi:uncharacterized Zn finger protein (UPF0148 family)
MLIMNDIVCPNCGKVVHIEEAVRHSLEKTILKEEAIKQKDLLEKATLEAKISAEKKIKLENAGQLEKAAKEKQLLIEKLERQEKTRTEFEEKAYLKAQKEVNQNSAKEILYNIENFKNQCYKTLFFIVSHCKF